MLQVFCPPSGKTSSRLTASEDMTNSDDSRKRERRTEREREEESEKGRKVFALVGAEGSSREDRRRGCEGSVETDVQLHLDASEGEKKIQKLHPSELWYAPLDLRRYFVEKLLFIETRTERKETKKAAKKSDDDE